jgi:hypothetical protein
MTPAEIALFFPAPRTLLALPHFSANDYAVPTLEWLQGPFWDFFKTRYWATDSDKWKFRWECRDFARAYACAAQECWGNSAPDQAAESDALAVGEFWFNPEPGKGHAICPAFTEQGLVFIDPQTNALCALTTEQYSSRYFLRF